MTHKKISFLIVLFAFHSVAAQNLQRRGSLGAVIGPNLDTTAVLINEIIAGATAQSIGIKDGDEIISINKKKYSQVTDVVALTTTWRSGDPIQIEVKRNGKKKKIKGKIKARPLETSSFGKVVYGHFDYKNNKLRTILTLPKNVQNPPVVFYIQGFGCNSIDFYFGNHPVKILSESLVEKGYAVYKIEKPSSGDSSGDWDCYEIGYNKEVEVFHEALASLKTNPLINPQQIFLFGHSLGGITSVQLAAKSSVQGIINYGSVSTSWYEYMMRLLRDQSEIFGQDFISIQNKVKLRGPIIYDYLVKDMSPDELRKNPEYAPHLNTGFPLIDGNKAVGRHYTFMQEINDVDISSALKAAATNVLALQGEFDIAAIDHQWAEHTAKVVNAYHPGKGEWQIVEKAEHGFATINSREEQLKLRQAGELNIQYMSEHFNYEIPKIADNWMQKILGNRQKNDVTNMLENPDELPYFEIPSYPENFGVGNVISRTIDGWGYRYFWATQGLTPKDLDFRPEGVDTRSINETLDHLSGLSVMVRSALENVPFVRSSTKELSFKEKRSLTLKNMERASKLALSKTPEEIAELAIIFQRGEDQSRVPFWHVLNGPIADGIWHAGQIVLMRRSAGNPIYPGVNVFQGKTK